MAYDFKEQSVVVPLGTLAASAITSTGVPSNSINYLLLNNARVTRLYFKVTTAMSSSAAAVLNIYARPTFGSASNQVLLGSLTIPAAATADQIYYKDITPANRNAGDQLVLFVSTASTSAGGGIWGFEHDLDPEAASNQSALVASA